MEWIRFIGLSFPPTRTCAKFSLAAIFLGAEYDFAYQNCPFLAPHLSTVGKGRMKSHMGSTGRTYKAYPKLL